MLMGTAGMLCAQPDPTETFLVEHELDGYTETYLRARVDRAVGDSQNRAIARLGSYYANRLAVVSDAIERERLLDASGSLLRDHDNLELAGLRLAVAIARYRPAEELAERSRLLLTTEDEDQRAIELLAESREAFNKIGLQLERDVLYQERRQRTESIRNPGAVVPELAEAIRNRSLAKFYAGWSIVYEASLTETAAGPALDRFAWVLDTPNEIPSLERLPRSLLRLDHVARTAIGVATAFSLMGEHESAVQWIDAVGSESSLSEAVRDQLLSRKIDALARAGRWEGLRLIARESESISDMGSANARLLAVVALTHRAKPETTNSVRLTLEDIARAALNRLVDGGDLEHVIDLSNRFQNLPLDGDGFAVAYVLGSDLFTQARDAHRTASSDPGRPAKSVAVRGAYRNAAQRLLTAVNAMDAHEHPRERAQAAFDAAACLYYAESLDDAKRGFLLAEELGIDGVQQERALWMAFVVSDALFEEAPSESDDRDELAGRYLAEHPNGPRAATMLLRTLSSDLVTNAQAIKILSSVAPNDPIAGLAKRELARMLYRQIRTVQGIARSEVASDFLNIAQALLELPESDPNAPPARARSQLGRQILDVALLLEPPRIDIARATLGRFTNDVGGVLSQEHADELALRRVQLALAEGKPSDARRHAAAFPDAEGRFAVAAYRLLWQHSLADWKRGRSQPKARILISDGQPFSSGPHFEPSKAEFVADAAEYLWHETADDSARETAIMIDRQLLADGQPTERSLRRLAGLAESASMTDEALNAWLVYMSAQQEGTAKWFEARYESLRLLHLEDPERARVVFAQLASLYPSLGSEPWSSKLRTLERSLSKPAGGDSSP